MGFCEYGNEAVGFRRRRDIFWEADRQSAFQQHPTPWIK